MSTSTFRPSNRVGGDVYARESRVLFHLFEM